MSALFQFLSRLRPPEGMGSSGLHRQLCGLAARSDSDRIGGRRMLRVGANYPHFRPVVRKFLATIQADDVGPGDGRRYAAPKFSSHRDGKTATVVRTTEEEIEQTHKTPLPPVKRTRRAPGCAEKLRESSRTR